MFFGNQSAILHFNRFGNICIGMPYSHKACIAVERKSLGVICRVSPDNKGNHAISVDINIKRCQAIRLLYFYGLADESFSADFFFKRTVLPCNFSVAINVALDGDVTGSFYRIEKGFRTL